MECAKSMGEPVACWERGGGYWAVVKDAFGTVYPVVLKLIGIQIRKTLILGAKLET